MFKLLLTALPATLLALAPVHAQVSYGDRSGYESPRTERSAPAAPRPETLAPRSRPPISQSQTSSETQTQGTVLEMPAQPGSDGGTLYYESIEVLPPQRSAPVDLPRQGTTQADVRARFGNPVRSFPAVGQPPITRWDYQNFRVFFEYNLVLHAVVPGDPPPITNRDELVSGR